MYTLRIVFEDKTEQNINLGNSYRVIGYETKQFKSMECEYYGVVDEYKIFTSELYKFIITEDNHEIPLFLSNKNYIVSENGSTFAKL